MLNLLLTITLMFTISSQKTFADATVKFLLIGDSWAETMCFYDSIDKAMKKLGISTRTECWSTSKSGSTASYWASEAGQIKIKKALENNPGVEVAILSIGGNDTLQKWSVKLNSEQEEQLWQVIYADIKSVIDFIQNQKPKIKIVISGYDYVHFENLNPDNPLYNSLIETFQQMGEPTPLQMNRATIELSKTTIKLTSSLKNVFFSNHLGLMVYSFGHTEYNIEPETTVYPGQYPDYSPVGGGLPQYANTPDGMRSIPFLNFIDAIHLNKDGYQYLADHMAKFYLRLFLQIPSSTLN